MFGGEASIGRGAVTRVASKEQQQNQAVETVSVFYVLMWSPLLLCFGSALSLFVVRCSLTLVKFASVVFYIQSLRCYRAYLCPPSNDRAGSTAKMTRKKALLIGINYTGTENALNGCHNDVNNVRDFLVNDRGFSDDSKDMVIMTDTPDNDGTPFWPSGENILAAFKWLTSYNQDGDIVWLSYSGHGGMDDR